MKLLRFVCLGLVGILLGNAGWASAQTSVDRDSDNVLADVTQGHENTSGRQVRQFGFPPPPPPYGFGRPPPPPPPFGGPVPFGYYGGFGGFGRTRVITRTRTRYVNRFGGFGGGGGFYG